MRTWRSKIVVWHSEKGIKWIEKYTRLCCLECLALGSYVPRFKAHPLLESPRIWNLEKNDSGTRENDHEEIKDVPLSRSLLSLSVPPSHSLSLTHSRRECVCLCVCGGEKKREREFPKGVNKSQVTTQIGTYGWTKISSQQKSLLKLVPK